MGDKWKVSLSDDVELVAEIRRQLADNDGYCPCRIDRTPETKCMCQEFRSSEEEGTCHCGLYVKTKITNV